MCVIHLILNSWGYAVSLEKITGYLINIIIIIYVIINIFHLNGHYVESIKNILYDVLFIALGFFIYAKYQKYKGTKDVFNYFNYFMIFLYILALGSFFGKR